MSTGSTGPQDYRAVALLSPSGERLLCLGETPAQIEERYMEAWDEVIRDEDRPTIKSISLQKWSGEALAGKWVSQKDLPVPSPPDSE